jgi:hypothetical protein
MAKKLPHLIISKVLNFISSATKIFRMKSLISLNHQQKHIAPIFIYFYVALDIYHSMKNT